MAMENDIPNRSVQTPCSVQDIQRITFLRTDGNRIYDRRIRILSFQSPLMIVQMEYMRLFDSSMNQTDLRRIPYIRLQDRWRRISIDPGTHGNIFSRICMFFCQRHSVPHGFCTIADCCCSRGKPCMRIFRLITIFVFDFQFIMEKYRIFPKSRFPGMIDICKQSTFQLFSALWVQPSGFCFFHNNRTK